LAAQIILTRFENDDQGMPLQAVEPEELAIQLPTESGVPIHVVPNVADALALAVNTAQAAGEAVPVVVTGSLYLLAEVYAVMDGEGETPP
jgi:folylpolyglutamate synthase/dihydropteroate synthase